MPASTPAVTQLGRRYLFEVAYGRHTYLYESDALPRGKDQFLADAIEDARQHDDLMAVWEFEPGQPSRDVSADVARALLDASDAAEAEDLSDFIRNTLTEAEVAEHFIQADHDARYCRELASPEATGRI